MLKEQTRTKTNIDVEVTPVAKKSSRVSPLVVPLGLAALGGLLWIASEVPEQDTLPSDIEKIRSFVDTQSKTPQTYETNETQSYLDGKEYWTLHTTPTKPPTSIKEAKKVGRTKSIVDGKNADKISFQITHAGQKYYLDIGVTKLGDDEYLDVCWIDEHGNYEEGGVCDGVDDLIDFALYGFFADRIKDPDHFVNWLVKNLETYLPERHKKVLGIIPPEPHRFSIDNIEWVIAKIPSHNSEIEGYIIVGMDQSSKIFFDKKISFVPVVDPQDGLLVSISESNSDAPHDAYTGIYMLKAEELNALLRNDKTFFGTKPHPNTEANLLLIDEIDDYILRTLRSSHRYLVT